MSTTTNNSSSNTFMLSPKEDTRSLLKKNEKVLEILKVHFDSNIREVDPYLTANVTALVNRTVTEVCGEKWTRPSVKQVKKIHDLLEKRLRSKYGRFVDLLNFRFVNRRNIFAFTSNLNNSYRHPKGLLYGHYDDTFLSPLFYTTHSLDRFMERVDSKIYNQLTFVYKKTKGSVPTSYNILDILTSFAMSWGTNRKFYYLNVFFGVLVLEPIGGVLVCKTFLSPDMIDNDISWFEPEEIDLGGEKGYYINTLTDLFSHKSKKYTPDFSSEEGLLGYITLDSITELMRKSLKGRGI